MNVILDVVFLISDLTLRALIKVLFAVNVLIPDGIEDGIEYFAGYILYFHGIFPVDQLLLAVIFVTSVWIAIYAIKLFITLAMPLIPFFGSRIISFPSSASSFIRGWSGGNSKKK